MMISFRRLQVYVGLTVALALGLLLIFPAGASTNTTTQNYHILRMLAPTNLHLPTSVAECVSHLPLNGTGYYDHDAYGCSHPTQNYTIMVWNYPSRTDGFHVYRVDGSRQDYGIHHDGTWAQIYYPGGSECFVVAAVVGTTESPDSNELCLHPLIAPHQLAPIPH